MPQLIAAIGALASPIIFFIMMSIFSALPLMWCWNIFMTQVLDFNSINYIQAFCLMILICLLKTEIKIKK